MAIEIKQGMSLNDLIKAAKHSKEHKKLFTGLALIDKTVQDFVKDIMGDVVPGDEITEFFIKTELMNQCYSLYIFNRTQQVTIGMSWPMADFLTMCSKKTLEMELNTKVRRIFLKFKDKGLSTGNRINWLY